MIWLVFGFLTAFFESIKDLCGKQALTKTDPLNVVFAGCLIALPMTIPAIFLEGIPKVDLVYFVALFSAAAMHCLANILYVKAIKSSPLSVTLPMISFTPIFMMLSAPFMINESPNRLGFIGVVLIVCGAYFLNISERKKGVLAPFKALLSERGPRLMLLVSFIWSISGNIDRIGISHSNLHFWLFSIVLMITLMLFPFVKRDSLTDLLQSKDTLQILLAVGFFNGLSMICYIETIDRTLIAYAVSVKRFSILLGLVGAYFLFKERNVSQRFFGATIMLAGLILVSFGS